MDKKTFNTLLATVVAGTMTLGVASFAKKAEKHPKGKGATTETKGTEHKDGEKSCGDKSGEHKDGEKSCGDKKE